MCSSYAVIGDYAVNNIKPFIEVFPLYLRKNNLAPSTKVSRTFIEESEEKMNHELNPNQEDYEMFK